MTDAVSASARQRLVDAAFELVDEQGYEHTTIDDITERAGLSRTTFFRYFRVKEEVLFPQHVSLMADIRTRLAAAAGRPALLAVTEAVRVVLMHHLDEGDRARRRYVLTSRTPALRDHEIATGAQYQRLFREHIRVDGGSPAPTPLQAELMAAAVVAAHNHVLRRWLRGEADEPADELDRAMAEVVALFDNDDAATAGASTDQRSAVVVFTTAAPMTRVLPAIQALLGDDGTTR